MACRSLPVVSEPILPSGTAPTLLRRAVMSEVDSGPPASTPVHSCRARVVAGANLPAATSAPEFCPPDDPPESELEPPPGWAFGSAPPLALVRPARFPQVGQAPGP